MRPRHWVSSGSVYAGHGAKSTGLLQRLQQRNLSGCQRERASQTKCFPRGVKALEVQLSLWLLPGSLGRLTQIPLLVTRQEATVHMEAEEVIISRGGAKIYCYMDT